MALNYFKNSPLNGKEFHAAKHLDGSRICALFLCNSHLDVADPKDVPRAQSSVIEAIGLHSLPPADVKEQVQRVLDSWKEKPPQGFTAKQCAAATKKVLEWVKSDLDPVIKSSAKPARKASKARKA